MISNFSPACFRMNSFSPQNAPMLMVAGTSHQAPQNTLKSSQHSSDPLLDLGKYLWKKRGKRTDMEKEREQRRRGLQKFGGRHLQFSDRQL